MKVKIMVEITGNSGRIDVVNNEGDRCLTATEIRNNIMRDWFFEITKGGKVKREEAYSKITNRVFEEYNENLAYDTVRDIINNQEKRYKNYTRRPNKDRVLKRLLDDNGSYMNGVGE